MTAKERFWFSHQRAHPMTVSEDFSDEEMIRDWTLAVADQAALRNYRRHSRLYIAIQLCAVRLYGRFLHEVHNLSPRIITYLNRQLALPPSLTIHVPHREATLLEHHTLVLTHLGFRRFDATAQAQLGEWITHHAQQGVLPKDLFHQAEHYLLHNRILLPGPSTTERLITHICTHVHAQIFESLYQRLAPDMCQRIDELLTVPEGAQRSVFYQLKEYPPAATITALRTYLKRYQLLAATGIDDLDPP